MTRINIGEHRNHFNASSLSSTDQVGKSMGRSVKKGSNSDLISKIVRGVERAFNKLQHSSMKTPKLKIKMANPLPEKSALLGNVRSFSKKLSPMKSDSDLMKSQVAGKRSEKLKSQEEKASPRISEDV